MSKYCIYKNPDESIEAWKYIDDIDEAMEYWYVAESIQKYGVDDTMPICMNKYGGYHPIDRSRCIAIIESESWPNIANMPDLFRTHINNANFTCGWIDSDGNTYSCGHMEHTSLARDFCTYLYPQEYTKWKVKNAQSHLDVPDDYLISIGWIRVSRDTEHFDYDTVSNIALKKLDEYKNKWI